MSNPIGTWTLFQRENKRFLKVWMQTILAPVISNLLFIMVFGLSLHRSIGDVQGLNYLQFIVPGLIIMGIINNAFQNPSSSIMIMKYQNIITDLLIVPLKSLEFLLAFIGSAVLRGVIVGTVTYLTAIFFVDFTYPSITIILTTAILVALFFGFLGIIVGIWASVFDQSAFIMNFVMMPLIFLGGVFYPITTLPTIFAQISSFNPIVYMINLLRYGFTGVQEYSLLLSFSVLGGLTLILGITSYLLLRSGWRLQT